MKAICDNNVIEVSTDSNVNSVTSNNTYLNINKKNFTKKFKFKEHRNRIFTSNTDLEKRVILSEEKAGAVIYI